MSEQKTQLTMQQIKDLMAVANTKGSRKKTDSSEPRTTENWWKQQHRLLSRAEHNTIEVKCSNPECLDPRPNDRAIILGEVNGTLMCRFCFLGGFKRTGD